MAHYRMAFATAMSPQAAFDYMADITHFAQWDPGVSRAALIVGSAGSVGAEYDLSVKFVGTTVMRYTVTEVEAPRRLVLVAQTSLLTSTDEITVAASPTGSVVTYDATLTLKRARLADPLLQFAFNRIGDRAAAGLGRALAGSRVGR
jgi:Polyketide cyclase / dehydrase and lipid transport